MKRIAQILILAVVFAFLSGCTYYGRDDVNAPGFNDMTIYRSTQYHHESVTSMSRSLSKTIRQAARKLDVGSVTYDIERLWHEFGLPEGPSPCN